MMIRSCSRCRSTVLVLLPQKTTMMISLKKKKKRRGFVSARKTRTPKPPLASGYPRTARLVSSTAFSIGSILSLMMRGSNRGGVVSDFCGEKRIKFKKPLFFSSVFFRLKHRNESSSEKGIVYI